MVLLPILCRIFQAEAGTEEPQFLEKHRESGLLSLLPVRCENWARNKVGNELSNLKFSFLAFLKMHFFILPLNLS